MKPKLCIILALKSTMPLLIAKNFFMKNVLLFLICNLITISLLAQKNDWKSGYYVDVTGSKIDGFFEFKIKPNINGFTFSTDLNQPNSTYLTPEVVQEIFIEEKYYFVPIKRKIGGVDNLFFGMRVVDGEIDLLEVNNEKASDRKLYYILRDNTISFINFQNLQGFLLIYFSDCPIIVENVNTNSKYYRYHFNSLSDLVLDYQKCSENPSDTPEYIIEKTKLILSGGIQFSHNSGNFSFTGEGYYSRVDGLEFSNLGFGIFGEIRLKVAGIRLGLGYQENESFTANQVVITHPDYNITDLTLNTKILEVPISFRYYMGKNDWSIFPEIGLILNFVDGEFLDPYSRRVELVDFIWTPFELNHEVRSFSMGAMGGIGIGRNIGKNYRLRAGYRFIFKNLNSRDALKTEYDIFQKIHQPYLELVRMF
jgi:hypothetical protein